MSTLNTNIDNDPFPVFTPRNLGRSPIQMQLQHQNIQLTNSAQNLNALIQSQQQTQFQSAATQRFTSTHTNLIRSPNNSTLNTQLKQHDLNTTSLQTNVQSRLMHSNLNQQNFVLPNMLQNMSLNSTHSPVNSLANQKLHTPSSTPPPITTTTIATTTQNLASSIPNAHRKLFPLDSPATSSVLNHQLNVNDQLNTLDHQEYEQLQNRVAPPDLSNILHLKRSDSYFISDELRSEIMRRNLITLATANQDIAMLLPPQVKDYHNLVPLDNQQINNDHKSRTFGYQTISYKATHIKTNCVFYLKRILGFRFTNQRCAEVIEIWKKMQHANIISLRDVFGTKEFGDHSIIFVYDYYPGLETLQCRLYNNPNFNLKGWANPYNLDGTARPYSAGKGKITLNGSRALGLLPEQTVWDYILQLTSIIRTIHSANLSVRILTPSRILIDHKSRLRLSGIGIFDVIDYDNSINSVLNYQQEDLTEFGRLVLALACNSLFAIQKEHINTSIDIVSRNYSVDMRNLVMHFLQSPPVVNNRVKNINDAMPMIGLRFYSTLETSLIRGDIIENELSKEIENGRLFRLIAKLNIVLDRHDSGDLAWSETGDRYMLKLFRDYVFHQVNSSGAPWVDLSHIVQCLNKFDTGSPEKICLVSPDAQNIMIVTYSQLKKCFDKVFNELNATAAIQ